MQSIFENYIQAVKQKFVHHETSEMGYRSDFEHILKQLFETLGVKRIDHDARAKDGNKPDFIVIKGDVPILYIEAKNIGINLDKVEKSQQMARYFGYANLVLTDYIEFRFYRNGIAYCEPIKLANIDLKNRIINPLNENFEYLEKTLIDFTQSHKEPIKSGSHLAKIMGGKAQRIRDNVRHFLSQESEQNKEIIRVYEAIKQMLVHDLNIESFSDMYAQTLVYGLFVARYYDESANTFTRQEARDLVPASNPFLQHFFDHIAGPNFDKRLSYIVDELCEVFQHANTRALIEEYMGDADPVIHFYEDFLKEYDPELRKKMGAYYTPLPVVRFIVRSVDEILQKDFNLPNGLADTSKLKDGRHKVQILDPAVGTGTFISATIRSIYEKFVKQGQEGRWPAYVHNDLLPRLHGFELMMAPYTIAHLKLSLAFKQTGFWKFHRRLGVYLTNSLEQNGPQQDLLSFGFAESIAEEAKEAEKIKNETPVMVIIGNPPYSGVSSNETAYANSLVEKYKVEPGGEQKLQERKHWLNDDYVKFIALAEGMVKKAGEGVVAMITNNGYLDNPTFRGMRWNLANTFDQIYILDLHGNVNRKESGADGIKDENVFNIMQGVSIILAVKSGKKRANALGEVYHAEIYGKRELKFKYIEGKIKWEKIKLDKKMVFFLPKNTEGQEEYEAGVRIDELFLKNVTGILTMGDSFIIDENKKVIAERIENLALNRYSESSLNKEFNLGKNYANFIIKNSKELQYNENKLTKIAYRPFDIRWTYFDNKVLWRWREEIMKNFIGKENLGLVIPRQAITNNYSHVMISNTIIDNRIQYSNKGIPIIIPLYIFHEDGTKSPNLSPEIVQKFEEIVGETQPEQIFYYIYAVLYSPIYREKYKEFLKVNFPRIPFPKDLESFKKLSELGSELKQIHLLESPIVNQFITTFPLTGSNIVEKVEYKHGSVFINTNQYFGKVPEIAWSFYIGGYQPIQKWLKDRKNKTLTNEDIEHYQKIIVAMVETDELMKRIDKIFRD